LVKNTSKSYSIIRIKLWCEHLDIDEENDTRIKDIRDFRKGFDLWKKVASENADQVVNRRPLQGFVYYFNFEEMNYPPPYEEAADTNKFHLI